MPRPDYTAPTFADVPQPQWGSPPAGAVPLDAAHLNAMAQAIGNSARQYAVNVKDYGAKGDGTADDTAAIQAAAATGQALFFPAGNYKCSPNLDVASPRAIGADQADVTITLGAGSYLFDSNRLWSSTRLKGVTVTGGAGVLRNRYTGSNVTTQHTVTDCVFLNYTGAAISAEASDMPLWRIERNTFRAANQTTSIGIALPGLTDASIIRGNEFQSNYVHIKLAQGGNNAYVSHNDFIQYQAPVAGLRRTAVWVVPQATSNNSGSGFSMTDNKFGNENLGVDDLRVAYADEGAGTYFGGRLPKYSADSAGFITGHTIRGGVVNGGGSAVNPFIYSTTPNLRGCVVAGLTFGGSMPSYVCQIRTPITTLDPEAMGNVAGPFSTALQYFSPLSVSNQAGLFHLDDPAQTFETSPNTPTRYTGGAAAAGYVNLLQHRINAFQLQAGTTLAQVIDSAGGTDAAEMNLDTGVAYDYVPAGSLQANVPVWVEFDAKQGATNPVSAFFVMFGLDTAGVGSPGQYLRRIITPTAQWRRYRFLTYAPASANTTRVQFQSFNMTVTGSLAQIGRVRVYHAREPIPAGLVLPDVTTGTTAPGAGGAGALPATPAGYVTVHINGAPRQIPYY